jgi:hypothetical protein
MKKADYTARDPANGQMFGRIYLAPSPTKENAWFWTVSIDERRLATGYAMSDRDAAQAVEDAYFAPTRNSGEGD